MLLELMYTSCARAEFTDSDLRGLVSQSMHRNPIDGITGVLLYDGSAFMQILEGDAGAVDALYSSIIVDPRHYSVQLESRVNVQRRTFSKWAMKLIHTPIALANPCPKT